MKRLLSFLLLLFSAQIVFAHAGAYDRYLDHMASTRAMLITVFATHIVLLLCVKVFAKWLRRYKKYLCKIIRAVKRNQITTMFSSWLLCTIVYGIYVSLLSDQLFLFGGFLTLIFVLIFSIFVWGKKLQKKFLFGFRPLYYYLQSSIFIVVGLALYYVLCQYDWYRERFAISDYVCDTLSVKLYAQINGFSVLALHLQEIAIYLLAPYLLLGLFRLYKRYYIE